MAASEESFQCRVQDPEVVHGHGSWRQWTRNSLTHAFILLIKSFKEKNNNNNIFFVVQTRWHFSHLLDILGKILEVVGSFIKKNLDGDWMKPRHM